MVLPDYFLRDEFYLKTLFKELNNAVIADSNKLIEAAKAETKKLDAIQ